MGFTDLDSMPSKQVLRYQAKGPHGKPNIGNVSHLTAADAGPVLEDARLVSGERAASRPRVNSGRRHTNNGAWWRRHGQSQICSCMASV